MYVLAQWHVEDIAYMFAVIGDDGSCDNNNKNSKVCANWINAYF